MRWNRRTVVRVFKDSVEPMPAIYSEQLNVGADETELNTGMSPERLKPSHQALYIHTTISVRAKDLCIPRRALTLWSLGCRHKTVLLFISCLCGVKFWNKGARVFLQQTKNW